MVEHEKKCAHVGMTPCYLAIVRHNNHAAKRVLQIGSSARAVAVVIANKHLTSPVTSTP